MRHGLEFFGLALRYLIAFVSPVLTASECMAPFTAYTSCCGVFVRCLLQLCLQILVCLVCCVLLAL